MYESRWIRLVKLTPSQCCLFYLVDFFAESFPFFDLACEGRLKEGGAVREGVLCVVCVACSACVFCMCALCVMSVVLCVRMHGIRWYRVKG